MRRLVLLIGLGGAALLSAGWRSYEAPTRVELDGFITSLDRKFDSRNSEGYLAQFASELHPEFHANLERRLALLTDYEGLTAKTRVLVDFPRGGVRVAALETVYSRGKRSLTTHSVVAIERRGGDVVGRFRLPLDKSHVKTIRRGSDRFFCPACNYELRFEGDWLAIPVRPVASGCMEALLLVSLRLPIHLETAVHIGDQQATARQAMDVCVQSEQARARLSDEKPAAYVAWTPGAPDRSQPEGLSAIRAVRQCKQGLCSELNLVAMGRLRYLMVVRGHHEVIGSNRGAVDAVLNSFRLLDPKLTAKKMADRANHVHTGKGTLSGDNQYVNNTHKLAFRGPIDWRGSVQAGPWLFQLRFVCPSSRASLHVRALPRIGREWTCKTVDGRIAKALKRDGRTIVAGTERKWKDDEHGFRIREFHTKGTTGDATHIARYAVREDVLVILDGRYPNAEALSMIDAVLGSLAVLR